MCLRASYKPIPWAAGQLKDLVSLYQFFLTVFCVSVPSGSSWKNKSHTSFTLLALLFRVGPQWSHRVQMSQGLKMNLKTHTDSTPNRHKGTKKKTSQLKEKTKAQGNKSVNIQKGCNLKPVRGLLADDFVMRWFHHCEALFPPPLCDAPSLRCPLPMFTVPVWWLRLYPRRAPARVFFFPFPFLFFPLRNGLFRAFLLPTLDFDAALSEGAAVLLAPLLTSAAIPEAPATNSRRRVCPPTPSAAATQLPPGLRLGSPWKLGAVL